MASIRPWRAIWSSKSCSPISLYLWSVPGLTGQGLQPISPVHDDVFDRIEAPPPPYRHGTGALSRVITSPCRRILAAALLFLTPALLALVRWSVKTLDED